MEVNCKIIVICLMLSFSFGKNKHYDIKLYGIKVAECSMNISDTTLYDFNATEINFDVKSTSLMNWFFNVSGVYKTIIKKNDNSILYFSKSTKQPNLKNEIHTVYNDNLIQYKNSNFFINNYEQNIFSLLYLISVNKWTHDSIVLDREGKKYDCEIVQKDDNMFTLKTKEININEKGLIPFTDIFSWAIFLPKTQKIIKVDKNKKHIEFCKFKRGLLTFSARIKDNPLEEINNE